jgi:hypothetical protein
LINNAFIVEMSETGLRSRQKVTSKPSDKTPEEEKEPMLLKNRKPSSEHYEFGEIQRVPANVRDIMDKNFFRLFTWELYFGEIDI